MANKSLLIVEGNAVERAGLAAILERAGYDVLTAVNADHGLDILKKHTPDLILLDLLLANGGGGDFLQRKDEEFESIPVLGLLREDTPTPELPATAHPDDTLTKPLSTEELLHKIKRYCSE